MEKETLFIASGGPGRAVRALAGLVLLMAAAAVPAADETVPLKHGDRDRSFLLHLPAGYDGSRDLPLVLDFHGLTSTSSQQASISGFRAQSDQAGFIVAWPQGVGNSWNAGPGCCGTALSQNVDDVGFARAVVARLKSTHRVDARRVYVTGLSNGGAMTQRLAAEAADLFAAAAGVAGMLLVPAKPSRPIPILNVHGYSDRTVPYAGSDYIPGAQAAFQSWSAADQCTDAPRTVVLAGASKCETRTACKAGAEVSLCSLEGGHIIYLNDRGIQVADLAWDFLSRFSLEQAPAASGKAGEGGIGAEAGKAGRHFRPRIYRVDGRRKGPGAKNRAGVEFRSGG